jgi:hypothetical protein
MSRPPPLPRARAFPSLGPLAGLLARAKPPARSPHPLSLTRQPLSLAHFPSLADRPHRSAASSSPRTTLHRPLTAVPSIAVPSPHRKSSAPPRTPPLDQRPYPVPPHRGVSSAALCGINAGAVHLTGARRAPSLPFPRAPIKRPPRAPPSPHRPRPLPSSPRPSTIRGAPSSSPSPVSPPLLPLPLRWSNEQLSELSSSLTKPRTRSTTSQPQSLTQSPPAAIPAAELRHRPPDNPPTPSSQIKPTPRIASLCPC